MVFACRFVAGDRKVLGHIICRRNLFLTSYIQQSVEKGERELGVAT